MHPMSRPDFRLFGRFCGSKTGIQRPLSAIPRPSKFRPSWPFRCFREQKTNLMSRCFPADTEKIYALCFPLSLHFRGPFPTQTQAMHGTIHACISSILTVHSSSVSKETYRPCDFPAVRGRQSSAESCLPRR